MKTKILPKISIVLLFFFVQIAFPYYAPPDGGTGTWVWFRYTVHVTDPYNAPMANVQVQMAADYLLWQNNSNVPYGVTVTGTTDANGYVFLEKSVNVTGYYPNNYMFQDMSVKIISANYTVLSKQNTSSNFPTQSGSFVAVYDEDGDSLDDNLERQLAEKFSPVLHKHSWDLQQDLSNVDWMLTGGKSTLKAYNISGQSVYNHLIMKPADIHVHRGTGDRDSFGAGDFWTFWQLDIDNAYRHLGAPVGQRPLYYHVYKQGSYYYVQYWYFFNMNDLMNYNQTVNKTWHEGDWEHVSIKVSSSTLDPVAVNFYRHEGGRTFSPADTWWSSTNAPTYSGVSKGYSTSRTHLNVWLAANSHASYNRYSEVYSLTAVAPIDFCISLNDEHNVDNADYDATGYDLYFKYDYLEKLGEYMESPLQVTSKGKLLPYAHGYFWFYHYIPKRLSKSWLTFAGRFGQFWAETCLSFGTGTSSPQSPVYESSKPSHEWLYFTENYNIKGFGNSSGGVIYIKKTVDFVQDISNGD